MDDDALTAEIRDYFKIYEQLSSIIKKAFEELKANVLIL